MSPRDKTARAPCGMFGVVELRGSDMAASVDRRSFLRSAVAAAALAGAPSRAWASGPQRDGVLDVIVIGAGLAGLTTARDLARAGNDSFAVLEARERVGGRTLNHALRNGAWSEVGGQWIGPGQTAVADLARELEIETFESEYRGRSVYRYGEGRVTVRTDGEVANEPQLTAELEALARALPAEQAWNADGAAALDRISLADWLDARDARPLDRLTFQIASILEMGVSPSRLSLLHFLTMIRCAGSLARLEAQKDGAQERRFHGGSQLLSIRMAEALGEGVRLGHVVRAIRGWDREVVEVVTTRGAFRAHSVVMALSPPLCERIAFSPALPAARRELQRRWPAHAPQMKAAAIYPSAFWFDAGFNGQVFAVDGPVIWSYDNSPPDHRLGVINAFLRAGEMPSDPALAERAVTRVLADSLRDDRLLTPLEFHVQDWGREEFTLSCVSPLPPGLLTSGLMPALTDGVGALIWAGSETADVWRGFMDGAVRSGHRAALLALQSLRSQRRA